MERTFSRPWASRRPRDLAREIDILLWDLCTQSGFCTRLKGADLVKEHPYITAELFANLVLEAEGMEPPLYPDHVRAIRKQFHDRLGSVEVSEADWARRSD